MNQIPSTDINLLWCTYKEEDCPECREQLIVNYAPIVKYVAGRVSSGLPNTVDIADLISYGLFGLIDAIEKFDLDRGIKFETYAIARIKGAIIDELRALDWVPRSIRSKGKDIESAYAALENRLMRTPTDAEVAEELGISLSDLNTTLSKLSYATVLSFDELWARRDFDDRYDPASNMVDVTADDPVGIYENAEVREILSNAIEHLPDRERIVVALYYYEGLTLKEIGQVLGVTESRVSQLHTKAVLRLRAKLHSPSKSVF